MIDDAVRALPETRVTLVVMAVNVVVAMPLITLASDRDRRGVPERGPGVGAGRGLGQAAGAG